MPSQPSNLVASDIGETSVTLEWKKPTHSGENIVNYELYWNDTYAKEKHHRRISVTETYTLTGLYPNTLYYVWLAARSQRGEGATTPPIPVRTKQYGKRTGGLSIPFLGWNFFEVRFLCCNTCVCKRLHVVFGNWGI